MNRQDVLERVLRSDHLPTLPTVASELVRLTGRDDTPIGEIANLITKDIALSAKVLKVVNSAYYNFPNQISTIQQAVSILGINAVRSLVLSFSFLGIRRTGFGDPFDYETFWERTLATAVAARLLAAAVDGIDADEAFTAALLQNIGALILARTLPEEYAQVMARDQAHTEALSAIEQEIIGIDHMEVGHEVASSWGFPAVLTEPIRWHHQPESYAGTEQKVRKYCQVGHLADLLVTIFYAEKPEDFHKAFRQKADRLLHLPDAAIARIVERVDAEVQKTGQFFGVNLQNLRPIEEILQEANARLSVLNMSYEQVNRELVQAKVRLQQLAKELEEKNRRLEKLANLDGLTEVYNHRYFQESLERELNRSGRNGKPLSLVLVDIDYFKKFNDHHGHQTGDFILREVCRTMQETLRKYDTLARYGGEEFAVILPETTAEDAEGVAEKLRARIDQSRFEKELETFSVTVSCGTASLESGERLTNSLLIERADQALYTAKKRGRNRVVAYSPKKGWFGRG